MRSRSGGGGALIDLHCHLLNDLDDGPVGLDAAVAMAAAQAAAGVVIVACTPHVDWQYRNDARAIADGTRRLQGAISAAGIGLTVVPGAEIGLSRAAELEDDELRRLRLGDGPWILLESPLSGSQDPGVVEAMIGAVARRGARILLAHPERSPVFQRDLGLLRRLVAGGALCQVTATSLTGAFGSRVQGVTRSLMAAGLVHVVASDAHDVQRRPPGIGHSMTEAGFAERVQYLGFSVPAAILNGGAIPPNPFTVIEEQPGPFGWWQRRRR